MEPVDTPDIKNVLVEEGQPLKFTADFETVPAFDPGDYAALKLRRPPAVGRRTTPWRRRWSGCGSARRGTSRSKAARSRPATRSSWIWCASRRAKPPDTHENVSIEIGATANPPGFDEQVIGLAVGEQKRFPVDYPADYSGQGTGRHDAALRA